jgi:cytochrome c peroxidase
LFFDKSLSVNNTTSCGSCHKQEFAFANNVQFDRGFNGLFLNRNSPSIQGFRGFDTFNDVPTKNNQSKVLLFWDGRQRSLADMVLNPVFNHNEMNMPSFEELVKKLSELSYYPKLFKNAFGDETITKERISFAMQSFIACLNTDSADAIIINPNISNGTTPPSNIVEMGQFLFHTKYNCAKCHDQKDNANPQQTGPYSNPVEPSVAMFNIGLDQIYSDQGLGQLTGLAGDNGLFKVPTLQNISVTGPYMHDGRFKTLGEVLDHYSHDIKANQNLSPEFRNVDGTPKKLNILPAEKNAIIAFLNTLRNENFLTSPMYSDPFKK